MTDKEVQTIKNDSGHKIGEAEYLNGKPHGFTQLWNSEGVLIMKAEMEFGSYHGEYLSW